MVRKEREGRRKRRKNKEKRDEVMDGKKYKGN
jgi:hypothetical protein